MVRNEAKRTFSIGHALRDARGLRRAESEDFGLLSVSIPVQKS
jgi:hypothetical protein